MPTPRLTATLPALVLALSLPLACAATEADTLQAIAQRREAGDWLGALALIEAADARSPSSELQRLRALTLLDLGASDRAWTLYRQRPELFAPEERARFEAARLARLIVWAGLFTASSDAREAQVARAQAALDALRAQQPEDAREAGLRIRFDELVLLNRAERHAEVVANYRALQAENVAVPAYARLRVAESLLAERHPDEAAPLFESVIGEGAGEETFDARILLAYAYAESERFGDALRLLETLVAGEPVWLQAPGARQPHPNVRHLEADRNLALMRLYAQDTPAAQARLEALAAVAPYNASLQSALGEVYQQRGWHARALERFRIASTLEPRHVPAALGQIGALTGLDRIDLARPLHDRLLAEHPRNVQVRQMDRDWRNRLGWQWQFEAASGRSRGDGGISPLGSRDGEAGLAVQSPLLGDRWRLTASAREAWADFAGERVRDRRAGVGIRFAFDGWRAEAGIDRARDPWTTRRDGAFVGLGWRASDTWHLHADWRARTPEASLQARRAGITADAWELQARWTPSERTALAFAAQQLRYSDGNRREALTFDGAQRVHTAPHLQIDALLAAYASRGSAGADVPYFNPRRDASVRAGARVEHLAWRRYERHLRQRAEVTVGPYRQHGFGTAWVPELRYAHEWRFGVGRWLEYGLSWSRPVYDGVRERHLGLDLAVRWGD